MEMLDQKIHEQVEDLSNKSEAGESDAESNNSAKSSLKFKGRAFFRSANKKGNVPTDMRPGSLKGFPQRKNIEAVLNHEKAFSNNP